jgi:hypothetical protein
MTDKTPGPPAYIISRMLRFKSVSAQANFQTRLEGKVPFQPTTVLLRGLSRGAKLQES